MRQMYAANVGGKYMRQMYAANVGGKCRRQMYAANVGGKCRRQNIGNKNVGGKSVRNCKITAPHNIRQKQGGR